MTQLNEQKFHALIGKMLGDLGGAFSVPTVRIGLRLGLFDALHKGGPATAQELAARAGALSPRYIREWLLAQSANGFIDYDAASLIQVGTYHGWSVYSRKGDRSTIYIPVAPGRLAPYKVR